MDSISMFETDLGFGAVRANGIGVKNVYLPHIAPIEPFDREEFNGMTPSALTERVAIMLKLYFNGICQPFDKIPVDLDICSQFRKRILEFIRSIPFGEVRSYGEVAAMTGAIRAARAVGGAMASNPMPVIIPCHRVIAGDGRLVGFSAPGGIILKKILLQLEGVEFKGEVVCHKK